MIADLGPAAVSLVGFIISITSLTGVYLLVRALRRRRREARHA